MKIYLCGYIQGGESLKKCIEWRKKIRKHYEEWKKETHKPFERYPIIWLCPLNGKDFNSISKDGLSSSMPNNTILHRDFKAVMDADIIVANMDTFGDNRPLTGTIAELAWAWEHHKPIIMVTNEKKYAEHPFLMNFASWIVKDIDELLGKKIINIFYKGMVNAEY